MLFLFLLSDPVAAKPDVRNAYVLEEVLRLAASSCSRLLLDHRAPKYALRTSIILMVYLPPPFFFYYVPWFYTVVGTKCRCGCGCGCQLDGIASSRQCSMMCPILCQTSGCGSGVWSTHTIAGSPTKRSLRAGTTVPCSTVFASQRCCCSRDAPRSLIRRNTGNSAHYAVQ